MSYHPLTENGTLDPVFFAAFLAYLGWSVVAL